MCGAGPSGSVVVARLVENPHVRVLLVEAGDGDGMPDVMDPTYLNGRAIPLNMGNVFGSGSSINVCVRRRAADCQGND